ARFARRRARGRRSEEEECPRADRSLPVAARAGIRGALLRIDREPRCGVTLLALVLSVSLSELWQRATRDTSSHAAAARGVTAFARKQYDQAMASFARANALRPTPQSAFNLGTSQIASGKH